MDLLCSVVLVTTENVRLGAFGVAKLVYLGLKMLAYIAYRLLLVMTYHCAVCDQTNQSVLWEQAQAHDDRVLERLQTVLLLASVDDEQEDRWRRCGAREAVFDGCAAGVKLWWDLLGRDVLVVRWQSVSLQTERTYPHPGAHIDLAVAESAFADEAFVVWSLPEGVENGLAGRFAGDGVILEQRSIGLLLQWRVESTDWDNKARGFLFHRSACCVLTMRLLSGVCGGPYHARAGQRVPTQANAICVLDLTPLVFECLKVCHVARCLRGDGGGVWVLSRGGERGRPQFNSEGSRVRNWSMGGLDGG